LKNIKKHLKHIFKKYTDLGGGVLSFNWGGTYNGKGGILHPHFGVCKNITGDERARIVYGIAAECMAYLSGSGCAEWT